MAKKFDVGAVYTKYIANNNKFLLVEEDLKKELDKHDDPFSPDWGTQNPALFVFGSHVWEEILQNQFWFTKCPSMPIRSVRNDFMKELIPYIESGMDLKLFNLCAKRLRDTGFRYVKEDNFYEVPAILRVLAPSYENLCSNEHDIAKSLYLGDAMKGLPHSVLWFPYLVFGFHRIKELGPNKDKKVRTKLA